MIYEPPHDKTNKMVCAPSEDSDQPGHSPSLIRVFAVLSYRLSAQRRLWSDWADAKADLSLRWAHMPHCWICHEAAHKIFFLQFRAPDKMRICVFHSNLNVKNSIIFGNVRIMYAKHFPDTQLCPVSKRICFVYILMECGLLPIFP